MPFLSTAEALFWDNVSWNSALAPYRAKSKRKGIGWYMKPDEVIKRLAELGITIDRRTLSRYVKWKLVTPPEYRSGGKGVGPIVDYPEHAVAEAAAAAELMQRWRWKKEQVALARRFLAELDRVGVEIDEIGFDKLEVVFNELKEQEMDMEEKFKNIRPIFLAENAKIWWETVKYYMAQEKLKETRNK